MIDDNTLKQLLRIDDELMRLCKWLNEKRDTEIFFSDSEWRESCRSVCGVNSRD
jgi:hypothetical protein